MPAVSACSCTVCTVHECHGRVKMVHCCIGTKLYEDFSLCSKTRAVCWPQAYVIEKYIDLIEMVLRKTEVIDCSKYTSTLLLLQRCYTKELLLHVPSLWMQLLGSLLSLLVKTWLTYVPVVCVYLMADTVSVSETETKNDKSPFFCRWFSFNFECLAECTHQNTKTIWLFP